MKILQSKIFLIFICFVSAWFAAVITVGLQDQQFVFSAVKQNAAAPNQGTAPKQYQKILQTNLFHGLVYSPQSRNADGSMDSFLGQNADSSSIPVSSLPVKLTGTIILSDVSGNKAVINNGKEQHIYTLGDNVNGWKILEINREEVIIAQGAKKEKLVLRTENTIKQADFTYTLAKNELMILFSDVANLLQHVQLVPYNRNNIHGLQVLTIQPGTYLDNFHFQPQDILLQLNEMTIISYNDIAKFTSVANENEFTLVLLRNNRKITLKYTVH